MISYVNNPHELVITARRKMFSKIPLFDILPSQYAYVYSTFGACNGYIDVGFLQKVRGGIAMVLLIQYLVVELVSSILC